jgi:hypothetical protein
MDHKEIVDQVIVGIAAVIGIWWLCALWAA